MTTTNPSRVRLTFEDIALMHNAAKRCAQKVLPDSGVMKFVRLLRWAKPYVDEYKARVDNLRKQFSAEGEATKVRDVLGLELAAQSLAREIVHEHGDDGLPHPPTVTPDDLPQSLSSHPNNAEGVADCMADLGCALVMDGGA